MDREPQFASELLLNVLQVHWRLWRAARETRSVILAGNCWEIESLQSACNMDQVSTAFLTLYHPSTLMGKMYKSA
jgi:hypothetical protein